MNDLEKKYLLKTLTWESDKDIFSEGFDAGVKAERERIKKALVKYTDVDHVIFDEEIFPNEVNNEKIHY